MRAERLVPGEILEQEALHDLERDEEERADQTGQRSDQGGVQQHAPEVPEFELRHRGGSQTQNAESPRARATRSGSAIGFRSLPRACTRRRQDACPLLAIWTT